MILDKIQSLHTISPDKAVASLNNRILLEASLITSNPEKSDTAFFVSRRIRNGLAKAADSGLTYDTLNVPSGFVLRGDGKPFFLTRH